MSIVPLQTARRADYPRIPEMGATPGKPATRRLSHCLSETTVGILALQGESISKIEHECSLIQLEEDRVAGIVYPEWTPDLAVVDRRVE